MSEKKDDIESFFKNQLNKGNFAFDESQWQALESRLDAMESANSPNDVADSGAKMIVKWGIVPIVILITLSIRYADIQNGYRSNDDEKVPSVDAMLEESSTDVSVPNELETNLRESSARVDSPPMNQHDSYDRIPRSNAVKEGTSQEPSEAKAFKQLDSESNEPIESHLVTQEYHKTPTNGQEVRYPSGRHSDNKSLKEDNLPTSQTVQKIIPDVREIEVSLPVLITSMTSDSVFQLSKKVRTPNRWMFSVFVAPDFNSTSLSQLYTSFGESAGVNTSYLLHKNVRLAAGLSLSNPSFKAGNGEFNPEQGFWTNGIAPESTSATNVVLTMPVSIGYNLMRGSTSNLFLNLKTTTYWMLTENYDFHYATNATNLRQGWKGEQENFHLFGSFGLSLLYQKPLSRQFYLEVEPYLNNPLGGVGEGAVSLYSSGINIGVSFRPGRKSHSPPDG